MKKNILSMLIATVMVLVTVPLAVSGANVEGTYNHIVKTILEPTLDYGYVYSNSYYTGDFTVEAGLKTLCAKTGEEVEKSDYERVKEGGEYDWGGPGSKWGMKDPSGEIIVPVIYDEIGQKVSSDGLIMVGLDVVESGRKYGFVNTNGEVVVPIIYQKVREFSDGLVAVNSGGQSVNGVFVSGKWGFVNTSGEVVIPLIYDDVDDFYDGMTIAGIDGARKGVYIVGKWGVIDKNGDTVIPIIYDVIDDQRKYTPDTFEVRVGTWQTGKWGVINSKNEVIIPIIYDDIMSGSFRDDGIVIAEKNGKWGMVNLDGEIIIPFKYGYVREFSENFAVVRIGEWDSGKWGFVDASGEVAIPVMYSRASDFHNGLAMVKTGEWWEDNEKGFINTKGEVVIPLIYDQIIGDFSEDLVVVQKDGKWGAINRKNEVVVPIIYDSMWQDDNGLLIAEIDEKAGMINSQNEIIVSCDKYSQIGGFINGLAMVRIGGEWQMDAWNEQRILVGGEFGFINTSGEVVIPIEYQDAVRAGTDDGTEYIWVQKDGLWGILAITIRNCNCVGDTHQARELGRVRGDDVITTLDALEILKYISKNETSMINKCDGAFNAACITGNDAPTINDALEVLKYLVGLPNMIGGMV